MLLSDHPSRNDLSRPTPPPPGSPESAFQDFRADLHLWREAQATLQHFRGFTRNHITPLRSEAAQAATEAKRNAQEEIRSARDFQNVVRLRTSLVPVETSGARVAIASFSGRSAARKEQAAFLWQHSAPDVALDDGTRVQSPGRRKAAETYECGDQLWVAIGPEGPKLIRQRCKHRECLNCREWRGFEISYAAEALMANWKKAKFITLTRKPRDERLRDTVRSLLQDFNRLRRTALWKASAGEGLYVVEITRHKERKHFHVHLHCIVEASYIPQKALSASWERITGDSKMVWISKGNTDRAKYLGKYLGKGLQEATHPFEAWAFWEELSGVRMCATFGGAPSIDALQPEPENTVIAPLADVQAWAMAGDQWAQGLLEQIFEAQLHSTKATAPAPAGGRPPPGPGADT